MTELPPPNWFPDRSGPPGQMRFWDGTRWSNQTVPPPPRPGLAQPPTQPVAMPPGQAVAPTPAQLAADASALAAARAAAQVEAERKAQAKAERVARAQAQSKVRAADTRWYTNSAVVVLSLFLCFPVGLALTWITKWLPKSKVITTVAVLGVAGLINASSTDTETKTQAPTTAGAPIEALHGGELDAKGGDGSKSTTTELRRTTTTQAATTTARPTTAKPTTRRPMTTTTVRPTTTAPPTTTARPTTTAAPAPTAPPTTEAPYVEEPTTEYVPTTEEPTPAPQPLSGGGSTYYANCDAVRAAGAAPISIGDPGYSRKLDRDGDGIGCEN